MRLDKAPLESRPITIEHAVAEGEQCPHGACAMRAPEPTPTAPPGSHLKYKAPSISLWQ
jgi:hypothetical protein